MLDKASEAGVINNEPGEGMAEIAEESCAIVTSEIPASQMSEGRIG